MTPLRPMRTQYTHVFFDIGGVLGTNGWDREQRASAAERFGLDGEFDQRHHEVVGDWETGRLSLDEYLDVTVFYEPRGFTRDEFVDFMRAQSEPWTDTIAIARRLARPGGPVLMTLNNESVDLNVWRIESFGLRDLFTAFVSSCWVGAHKPSRLIYERALGIAGAAPGETLFVDDRAQNLAPARALGMDTVRFTDCAALERELRERGLL